MAQHYGAQGPYGPGHGSGSSPGSSPYGPSTPHEGPVVPPAEQRRLDRPPVAPRGLGRLPYYFVLCGVAAGLVVVAIDHFRRGTMLIGAAVFMGALARLVLPEGQAGMLAVRRRWADVLLMSSVAVAIMLIALLAHGSSS